MLNYEIYDNKKENWVVFIHGVGGSILTWKRQIDDFSENYNLLLLDLQGHGKSESNDEVTVMGVNESIKEVMDHCGITHADFIGLSLGTIVIAQFAIKYPNYVNSIILGGSVLRIDGIYKFAMRITNGVKYLLPKNILYRVLSGIIIPAKWHKKSRTIFIRESKKMKRKNFLSWIQYTNIAINPKKILDKLKSLNIKVFFISGDRDICFIRSVKKMAQYLGNAKLKIIKECGHVCTIEKYKEFNELALNYLKSIHAPITQCTMS